MNYQERLKEILLQFIAEHRQGLNELAGHGNAMEQALAAINALNAAVIGEDEPIQQPAEYLGVKGEGLNYQGITRNILRADLRKKFGVEDE